MGLLSSTQTIARYRVEGQFSENPTEQVRKGLKKQIITDIDNEAQDLAVGWTSFETPFTPDFEDATFQIGTHYVFGMRIDKKSIPTKVVKQQVAIASAKRLAESDREFLSKNEKSEIKDHIMNVLTIRIPPTPNVFDVVWQYEQQEVWLYSTQKVANEEFETLFNKSFAGIKLIRLFPYTQADLTLSLSDMDRDRLSSITPEDFTE
ncbi:recombination-associated protein RdgC [Desulfoluna sp.]|uniref:recombination-associated protein RdgC n=1 Tax=Desulfoluna sp. TaxID=2045199 RepID=UPI00263A2D5C|nr:recombination-associated protein RdgC [Desulfoluna sp.]